MPELPEVETVVQTLKPLLIKETITAIKILFPKMIKTDLDVFQTKPIGQTIHDIHRKGKFIIVELDTDVLIFHLRMEGKFFIKKDEPFDKHEHLVLHLSSGRTLRYHDFRKFGTAHLLPIETYLEVPPLNQVGPEPKAIDPHQYYLMIKDSKRPIKAILLDQTKMSGLGNIYVDETLFQARIHPERKAVDLKEKEVVNIVLAARDVLAKAVALGGTTIRSYTSSLGVHGRFQNELKVHTKAGEPCPLCGTPIIKIKVTGRGTYVCPKCQK